MFNFKDIVSDILLEQEQPVGVEDLFKYLNTNSPEYKKLIQVYTSKFGSDNNSIETNLKRYIQTVTAQKNYFAGKTLDNLGGYSLIPFYDAFAAIFANLPDKEANFTGLVQYIINPQNANIVETAFKDISDRIAQAVTIQEYTPTNELLIKARNVLDNQTNKLSQVAIQSLGSDSIHSAVVKIIAKRIPVLDRVMGLKGLVKPFNQGVITPVLQQFKRYTGYKQGDAFKNPLGWLKDRSWPKKISGDFSKMVEDISANNLLNVAVLAYEYYIYLLSTQGKPLNAQNQNQNTTDNQMRLPGFENTSLNLFDKFINSVILEYNPLPSHYQNIQVPTQSQTSTGGKKQPSQHPEAIRSRNRRAKAKTQSQQQPQQQNQTQETKGLPPEQIEKISSQVGNSADADYTSFLDDGVSRYLPDIKFDLNTISKDPSREAKALYRALTDMAYFVRKGVGAKERMAYAGQAASAITDFAGASLYGGPR